MTAASMERYFGTADSRFHWLSFARRAHSRAALPEPSPIAGSPLSLVIACLRENSLSVYDRR